ncbi:MAG TPA: cysteine desulfurase-like protein, partial [Pirellulales bacterium]|nr:cysteine desulfurase-like protein [Pirellulales bacterium]
TMSTTSMALDAQAARSQFPALLRAIDGRLPVYFDGAAGSQVPDRVIQAIADYLSTNNANHGGVFATSRASDAMLDEAHAAAADLLGCEDAATTAFGANMTTLTLALSRSIGRTWKPGDRVIVTQLDHDANVSPWVLAARDAGAIVECARVRPEDCTLDLEHLRTLLSRPARLVAVGAASNAVGTINPVRQIADWAHAAGAELFVDAVHFAPHRLIDVMAWDCDYLVCSAYKFFGPHLGLLWGRREHLERLPAYKLRPAPDDLPGRWMTGTQSHEAIAGLLAAIEYLADLSGTAAGGSSRRERLAAGLASIEGYETQLVRGLLHSLSQLPHFKVWGIRAADRLHERVPTVALRHDRLTARELAEYLSEHGIFVWHGNFYALPLTEALGLEPEGLLRISLLHYNTTDEIERLLAALEELDD